MTSRLPLIEYLRGLAALGVAWHHLTVAYPAESWVRETGSLAWLGVEVFFVISGFVIPLSIAASFDRYSIRHFPRFMARRLVRLEPPYLISATLALVLWKLSSMAPGFRGSPPSWNPFQLLAHFLYLIPLTDYSWIQPVYWTLAWEFVFYITLGLSFPLIGRADRPFYWYMLVAILFVLATFGMVSHLTLLFVIGVAVYRANLYEMGNPHRKAAALLVALAGLTIARTNVDVAVVGVVTGALIHFYKTFEAPKSFRGALTMLGTYSYSLYLVHVPIGARMVNLGSRFLEDPVGEFCLSLFALLCSLAFAWIFFRLVEKPSIAIARRLTTRER